MRCHFYNSAQRRLFSVVMVLALVLTTMTGYGTQVFASSNSGSFCSSYYKTNPSGTGVGLSQGISIDGDFSDWNSSMLIAQGVANDDARAFRGTHEGPVYDTYALYAAWDQDNLYFMWEITNVTDVIDPAQGYPISDNGKAWNGDIPQVLALDVRPDRSGDGMIGSKGIWGMNINYENGVDTVLCFSSKPGVGTPALFTLDDTDSFSYEADYCTSFKKAGISFAYGDGHISNKIMGIKKNCYEGYTPAELASEQSNWVNMMDYGHDSSQDTMYEMAIPLSALGIDRAYLEQYGIGAMHISTFGQSGITSIPCDPSMIDHAADPYECDDSTSAEKSDFDVITCSLARVGSGCIMPTETFEVPTTVPSESPSVTPSVPVSEEPSIEPTTEPSIEPSIQPSIQPSIEPTPSIPVEDNFVTVYYKSSNTTYMHYQISDGSWTVAPGVIMNDSQYAGYKELTINLGTATNLTACFNNGAGNWDNNNKANYSFTPGSYVLTNGTVKEGIPTISNNKITLYYKTSWADAYAHYRTGSNSWTVAPGEQMSSCEYAGYKTITINMGEESTLTTCFNNGYGNWDNNQNQNYYFTAPGTYTISNGNITEGTPKVNVSNEITLYYYAPSWSNVNCHYRIASGEWTAVPGVAMTACQNCYYKLTILLGEESTLTACFNNGSGTWDSRNGQNYYIDGSGSYIIKNGAITAGTPD